MTTTAVSISSSGEKTSAAAVLKWMAHIVMAFVQHNAVPVANVPDLLKSVHAALRSLMQNSATDTGDMPKPAVPIRKSVTADHIICLEDGKKLKILKRYLRSRYQLSPDQYRARWGLPADYPTVAPNYAAQRSAFAKRIGLGRSANHTKQRRKNV